MDFVFYICPHKDLWTTCGLHQRPQVEGDAAGVTTRGVSPHAPVNHTVFFLYHGFIKCMYVNKILMKTRL